MSGERIVDLKKVIDRKITEDDAAREEQMQELVKCMIYLDIASSSLVQICERLQPMIEELAGEDHEK